MVYNLWRTARGDLADEPVQAALQQSTARAAAE